MNTNIGFRLALDTNARSSVARALCPCSNQKVATSSDSSESGINIRPLDASDGCLYSQLLSFPYLYQCYKKVVTGKRKSGPILSLMDSVEQHIHELLNQLESHTYTPLGYSQFFVFEPKRRLVSAPHERDRLLHRAVYDVLYPVFDKTFIADSYACRVNRGTHAGIKRAQQFIRRARGHNGNPVYVLKADIKHYFSSVSHDILKDILRTKISCPRMLELLFTIIDSHAEGIPLGNLTSQLFANIYLHELDWYVKHTLKCKLYMRYMDDFIIVSNDKEDLWEILWKVEDFLSSKLALTLNKKTEIFKVGAKRLDYLGAQVTFNGIKIRRQTYNNFNRKLKRLHQEFKDGLITLKQVQPSIASWIAMSKHIDATNLTKKLFERTFTRS